MSQLVNTDTAGSPEHQKLVDEWLNYHRALENSGDLVGETTIGDPYLWAIERLDDLVRNEPEVGWRLILEIFVRTESDYQRASLAAGLLEDLLCWHGVDFIDRIEAVTAKDKAFRELLTGIWKNTIPDDVWERIQRSIVG